MFWIWGIGAALIFIAGFIFMAWRDGQGEFIEHDEEIMGTVFCAAFWPVILGLALAVAPFAGLYCLVRKISSMNCGGRGD